MFDRSRVAAKSVTEEARYPADRGDANAGQIVDAAIGESFLQKANDVPAIDQCLQLRGGAQVFEEVTAFGQVLKPVHRFKKGIFIAFPLADSVVSVGFHTRTNVIVY